MGEMMEPQSKAIPGRVGRTILTTVVVAAAVAVTALGFIAIGGIHTGIPVVDAVAATPAAHGAGIGVSVSAATVGFFALIGNGMESVRSMSRGCLVPCALVTVCIAGVWGLTAAHIFSDFGTPDQLATWGAGFLAASLMCRAVSGLVGPPKVVPAKTPSGPTSDSGELG